MTKIIAASTGTGKSTAAANSEGKVLDSDSDYFKYDRSGNQKVQKSEWPQNFIEHPRAEMAAGTYDAVLISAYGLLLPPIFAQVPITLVYPRLDMEAEMAARYRGRGNKGAFLDMLLSNFDEWITGLMSIRHHNVTHRVLQPGQYVGDILPEILTE